MKKFVQIYHFLIRSLSAGQKFISLLLNYKVLSVQLGIVLGLLLINANYYACLNIKATTTSTLEEVINPSYLDMNSSTGSVQFNSPIKQVNTTSEIQVSAAPQLQQPNISPLLQVITVPSLLRSNSDYEKTGTDQPTSGIGWGFSNGTLTLDKNLEKPIENEYGQTIWPWESLRSKVTTVKINDKIWIYNGSSMFAHMPNLTVINGLNNLCNLGYMNGMFDGDSSLESLNVENWDLSGVLECSYLFSYCTSLNDIKIKSSKDSAGKKQIPFQKTVKMSAMFFHCISLKNLDVSDWDVGKVQTFYAMFKECSALQSIKGLDNWNTASATDMSYMFASDREIPNVLTTLDLSKFNTANVENFSNMFSYCTNLESITGLGKWETYSATDMSNMFSNCAKLTSIASSKPGDTPSTNVSSTSASENLGNLDFSNFRTAKVKNFSNMFYGCTNLESITGLDQWETDSATDMSNMFSDCANLESITGLDQWENPLVTNMSSMFAYDPSLQKLDLSSFDTRKAAQDNFFSGDNKLWYLKIGKDTKLKDDCGLPDPPKDKPLPSEFPNKPENPKNPEYKTSQNGKWQKVIKKEEDDYWWQPNDDIYTNDEVIKDSQSNDCKLFIWQPAFSQTTKGSLVLNVSPSNIHFDIILGNKNKNEFSDDEMKLHYDVQSVGSSDAQWQLYAMMTKFKNNDPNSNTVLSIDILSLSLEDGVSSGQKYDLNQQPTLIRTSAENSSKWDLKPVLNVGNLDKIKNDGSSGTKTYTTTIDYDLVNSIQ